MLQVTYGSGSSGEQRIGLRFRNLGIPQGATIDSAVLELSPSRTLTGPVTFRIHGENTGDAAPFDTSGQTVSAKLTRKTDAHVDWSAATEWVARSSQGQVQVSPDLSPVLQEIVNGTDWCGGNDLALLIDRLEGSTWRAVFSYDGDPNFAPVLKVNYTYTPATAPPTSGCVVQTLQRQVASGTDDAEQSSSGAMRLADPTLEIPNAGTSGTSQQTIGLRFQDVRLDPGTEILDARLTFTASGTNTLGASMVIFGEASDNASAYASTANDLSPSSRPRTTSSLTWSDTTPSTPLTGWTSGGSYMSPNLKTIVQEVVDRSGWQAGNALAFVIRPGSGQRRAHSYNNSPAQSAVLQITYRTRVSETSAPPVTVRQQLKQTVNTLEAAGWTPIVDTLFEAGRYYRGEGLYWAKTRGADGATVERNTRVSHPASYTGGTVIRETGCTDGTLSSDACRSERIEGTATYISPVQDLCGSNYIILLTDGEANNNHSASLVRSIAGLSSCQAKLTDGTNVNSGEQCGIDLGRFLYTRDQLGSLAGTQTIATYTIGFNLDPTDPAQVHAIQFLKDLAKESGGQFSPANTAAELTEIFQAFFLDILNRSTSFAAPALSVNAFNKLYHRDDVYFSLFQPSDRIRWTGNVKKYRLCQSTADGCVLGQVLDSQGSSAIAADSRISDSAWSYWSSGPDGAQIRSGGAGNAGPASGNRRVVTFTGATPPAGAPFEDLSQLGHRVVVANGSVTNGMMGLDAAADTDARAALIDWIRGRDVDDEDEDGDTAEDRFSFGDPLHSSPQAVTYGGTSTAPVTKLFVGTNDGGLRMIDAETGEEEWIFYPPETLARQADLRANPNGRHVYGMDGTPTVRTRDTDGDGTVGDSSEDFVRVFVGMRRGGSHYYGLEVTPDSPLTTPGEIRPVYPKYMWRIDGGSAGYPQLGQTWSRPVVATVRVGTSTAGQSEAREVLLFAGGYDESQDTAFGPSPLGNAIYIADPMTGARKYWISGTAHSTGAGVQVPDMSYPIPSDLAVLDSNGDGAVDRMYVGDTGGQLWRIDLAPASGTPGGVRAVVGKLATVSSSASEADKRKFFYPPDVVQVLDSKYSDVARYDLVTIASGDREHPLSEAVTDRLYAFRDLDYGPMVDANGNGLAEGYPRASGVALQGPLDGPPAVAGDLFDATDVPQIESGGTTNLSALRGARGWFLRFDDPGEKGLASPVVLGGKLFITTFSPQATTANDVCQLMEGGGRLYGLDVLNAQPKFNWDQVGDIASRADRIYQLAAGIPSGAVPIFQEEGVTLLIGVGGGAETVDPNIALPRARTYWFQEQ
jgi:type IV pilus assembly protein PilY1